MAIKSEVVESKKKEGINYPCLMKSRETGLIVLFASSTVGTVMGGGECPPPPYKIGNVNLNYWAPSSFEPFYGSVTLSSDGDA